MTPKDKPLILIVDDNPQNLQMLGNMLRGAGYKVVAAQNGATALDFAEKRQPACILLDIMMPEMDGIETCRRLKARKLTQEIPVIFLTALTGTHDKVRAFEAGGVDYVTKPFQGEEVLVRVATHLSLRNLHKRLQEQNVQLQQEISERKRAETALRAAHAELKEKNAQLQHLNASKDRFFSIISHDLKNSFTVLLDYTENLSSFLDSYKQEELRKDIHIVRTETKQLYALLENLLTWSRLQCGVMEYQAEKLAVGGLIRISVMLFEWKAEQKQIMFTHSAQENTLAYVDHRMIDTVLRNLISNALKFTHPGDRVDVSATRVGDEVEVAVSDTGVGIPQKNLSKLFQIESRYTHPGTAGEKGTGLGLILCKELVKQNGGRIWVESKEGQGTTVKFTLPKCS